MRALPERTTPLTAILLLTFLGSVSTAVLWSGLSFIAKHGFGYDERWNFALYIVMAATYIVGAFASGPVMRRLQGRFSHRAALAWVFATQTALSLLPLVIKHHIIIWLVGCSTSVLAAMLWPIVESYLTAGRHGSAMRSAMGWWNITWTSAVALSMIGMAPFINEQHPEYAKYAIVALVPVSLLGLLVLRWFARDPAAHDEASWKASITIEYPLLLRSVRVLLPLSYLLIGALSPLMPYRLAEVGGEDLGAVWHTPATAVWMLARVLAVAFMWRLRFWHGRWGTLLIGGTGMAIGFAIIVGVDQLMPLLVGLALFGAAQGVVYYAALYYAMSVGGAAVDAGGTHEGLIGLGYTIGPAAALAGLELHRAGLMASAAGGIITMVTSAMALAAIPAAAPYLRARKLRRERQPTPPE